MNPSKQVTAWRSFLSLFKNGPEKPKEHIHEWRLEYRTGTPIEGKSEVCSCECGIWSVRHYGKAERHIINHGKSEEK